MTQEFVPPLRSSLADHFFAKGWCKFAQDQRLRAWIDRTRPHAMAKVAAPENAEWFRYGNTWFAGVNVLGNDGAGRVDPDSSPLECDATDFIAQTLGLERGTDFSWDSGQVSVCYPGYPQPMESESEGAYRYRVNRDAAHLDGLHPVGPKRRRHLREAHAFVLGIPLTYADEGAAPLVVWDGSHEWIRDTLRNCFADVPPEHWRDIDVTQAYQAVRTKIFTECPRTIVNAEPGECYLVHRLALHGVAPWAPNAKAEVAGRMIVYFRPEKSDAAGVDVRSWLDAP